MVVSRNGSEDGVLRVPFALNDPPGVWVIQATDVISGKTAELKVQLK